MGIRPLGNRVIVKPVAAKEKRSSGGVVLPADAKGERAARPGQVLAVGRDESIEVKVGDVVLLPRHGGTEFERDEHRLLIIKAADILAVVEET